MLDRLIMSTDCHLTASANRNHVIEVLEGSYHLQLIRFDFNALSSLLSIVSLHHIIKIMSRVLSTERWWTPPPLP